MNKKLAFVYLFIITAVVCFCITSCGKDEEDIRNGAPVSDTNGNVYQTLIIGKQTWMVENLRVTKYNDGTDIPNVTEDSAWASTTTGAYCNYDNKDSSVATYGRLYNWYAVNTGKLAPKGWHVPTDAEWTKLVDFLTENKYITVSSNTNDKLAKAFTSASSKKSNNETINNYELEINKIGFAAIPGGFRSDEGDFVYITESCWWWSFTEYDREQAYLEVVNILNIHNEYAEKSGGLSIRCVKN